MRREPWPPAATQYELHTVAAACRDSHAEGTALRYVCNRRTRLRGAGDAHGDTTLYPDALFENTCNSSRCQGSVTRNLMEPNDMSSDDYNRDRLAPPPEYTRFIRGRGRAGRK